jgi:POTRA domain-containing FtsQ-type protein
MSAKPRPPRSAARTEAAALPRRASWPRTNLRASLGRLAPSRRSLAVGCGIFAFALGAYLLARETSLFAVSRLEVQGGSPRVAAQVRQALAPLVGTSLVRLDGADVLRRVDALPTVVRASYDRAFPHTLRISVIPERPAAVLRRGAESWLVSLRGRVMERLPLRTIPNLPRIWVGARTPVRTGAELDPRGAGAAARGVGLAGAFGARVASASDAGGLLVFHLKSGLQLLLGDARDIRLKVAVATRALPLIPAGTTFLDVSVPGRPVSGNGVAPPPPTPSSAQQSSSGG